MKPHLLVRLCKGNADSLDRLAAVATGTGFTPKARGRVDTADSREAGLKLTLKTQGSSK